jgi:catechol 2,3-dioxygenase-like lactoylglutathione lyase family enzyme
MDASSPITVHFENSQPILRVENMEASLRFYVDVLGFKNAEWGGEDFTMLTRGGAVIYLCRRDQGRGGAWVWIGVDNAETLYKELVARGVPVRMPPTHHTWAVEIQVEDPDGNVIRFGSDPK